MAQPDFSERPVKILAICGSLGASSQNLDLLRLAATVAPRGVVVSLYSSLDALPHFNPDLERDGQRVTVVDELRQQVTFADALLIATPEYGFSLPGSLKNAIDWLIGSAELERKIVGVTASVQHPARGVGGIAALLVPLGAVSAEVIGALPLVRGPGLSSALALLLSEIVVAVRRREGAE